MKKVIKAIIFTLVFSFIFTSISMASSAATVSAAKMTAFEVTDQGTNSISLSWESSGKYITGYKLYKVDPVTKKSTKIKDFKRTTTAYVVTSLEAGTDYSFKIYSYYTDSNGTTVNSKALTATTFTMIPKVTGVKVSDVTETSFKLQWTAIPGIKTYQVYYYNTSKKAYQKLGDRIVNSCTVKSLKSATNYKIKIRAVATVNIDLELKGAFSAVSSITTMPPKMDLASKVVSNTTVALSWTAIPNVTAYKIYMYDADQGKYVAYKTLKSGETAYTITGLKAGKEYKFKARAYVTNDGTNTYGAYSNVVTTVTKLSAPTVTQNPDFLNNGTINLSWTKVSGASGYYIYISEHKNSDFVLVKTVTSASTVKATIKDIPNGVRYVKIRAYTTTGSAKVYSAYSKILEVRA